MRFTSPSALKATLLYTLLAVAHALPAPVQLEAEHDALERRGPPPPIKVPKIAGKPAAPKPPPPPPHGGPAAPPPPPVRLGQGAGAAGAPKVPAEPPKPSSNKPDDAAFKGYNAKIGKYSVQPSWKSMDSGSMDISTRNWFNKNGVTVGGFMGQKPAAPLGKEVKVYGGTKEQVQANNLNADTVWEGKINPQEGVMIRSREFREADQNGNNIDRMYPNGEAVKDRISTSDHMAKTWKDYGEGKPLKKVAVTDIKNAEAAKIWDDLFAERRKAGASDKDLKENGITLKPGDAAFDTIMKTSAGKPLASSIKWHPEVYNNQKVTEVKLFQSQGQYAIFNLGP